MNITRITDSLHGMTFTPKEADLLHTMISTRTREPEEFLTLTVGASDLQADDVITNIRPTKVGDSTFTSTLFLRFTVRRKNPDWEP